MPLKLGTIRDQIALSAQANDLELLTEISSVCLRKLSFGKQKVL